MLHFILIIIIIDFVVGALAHPYDDSKGIAIRHRAIAQETHSTAVILVCLLHKLRQKIGYAPGRSTPHLQI